MIVRVLVTGRGTPEVLRAIQESARAGVPRGEERQVPGDRPPRRASGAPRLPAREPWVGRPTRPGGGPSARPTPGLPRVEIVTEDELQADPALLETVEVVYGGLGREQFARARSLRWIQVTGAGVNGLLTPEVVASPVRITNASGIHAEPITEHFFGMLLMLTRRLNRAWDQQRAAHWESGPLRSQVGMIAGRTLGVLGVGAIGTHAARVGAAFGMRVIGLRRSPEPVPHVERLFGPGELEPFLAESDVVFDTLPLTPATAGLLDARAFAAIKPGAIVANVGRGGTIDTDALVEALRAGRLGGALLDVTDPEPLPADHPLWQMENVLITPHYAGNHPGYDARAAKIFLENLRRFLAGEALINEVDKAEGY